MKQFTNANQPGLDQNAYNEFTSCNEIVHQGNTVHSRFKKARFKK